MENNIALKSIVCGIILKINFDGAILYNFGNLIINGYITNASLSEIQKIWPSADHARVSAYVLPLEVVRRVRANNNGTMRVNETLLGSNLLQHYCPEAESQGRAQKISPGPSAHNSDGVTSHHVTNQLLATLYGLIDSIHGRNSTNERSGRYNPYNTWNNGRQDNDFNKNWRK